VRGAAADGGDRESRKGGGAREVQARRWWGARLGGKIGWRTDQGGGSGVGEGVFQGCRGREEAGEVGFSPALKMNAWHLLPSTYSPPHLLLTNSQGHLFGPV